MKKRKLITLIGTLLFSSSILAAPEKPKDCPEVSNLRGAENAKFEYDTLDKKWYAVYPKQTYNTNYDWRFFIPLGQETNTDQMKLLEQAKQSLVFSGGPYWTEYYQTWACLYKTKWGQAYTINE